MDIRVLDANPIYANATYRLRFRFSEKYPIEPPEVNFITGSKPPRAIPLHPHVYSYVAMTRTVAIAAKHRYSNISPSNGIICLDLLGVSGWSPVHTVESVCMSLQSMLTGNTKAEKPPGDEEFVRRTGFSGRTKGMGFVYDDDTV